MRKAFLIASAASCLATFSFHAARAADVVSFTLIDALSDAPIAAFDPIPANATINLGTLPTQSLSIRANTNGTVGSVKFQYSGPQTGTKIESVAPYALFGDTNGDYTPWTPLLGTYALSGQSFSSSGGNGTAGANYVISFTFVQTGADGDGTVNISASPKRWHAIDLTLDGPFASETGTPNPFLDYRMQVTFTNGAKTYSVPGYFAADGAAANSLASAGTKWRAHLSPDLTGTWNYTISFTTGTDVAVDGGGTPLAPYDGKTGSFTVAETDKTGEDFRAKGRLLLVPGQRYPKFANGEWFIKAGTDSPENLLGSADFDGTYHQNGSALKTWQDHVSDWLAGDPTWNGGKGKGLIGALNYLAAEKVNGISFLTYNAGGDGKDVWPFVAHDDKLHYDCSKLDQWNIFFAHAGKLGIHLHVKTQERENDTESPWALDTGNVGRQRKLYYRELIARFAHHLALTWNLGEENGQSTTQRQQMAQFFYDNDPYRHQVVLHTWPGEQEAVYRPLLGSASKLTGVSIQIAWDLVHREVLQWVTESTAAGNPWLVANDEQGPASIGVPDDAYTGTPSQAQLRATALWGTLLAGGFGMEAYFGYDRPDSDLTCQNFRRRDRWWDYARNAALFMRAYLPFTEMANANGLAGNATNANGKFCFAKAGEVYCIYLQSAGTTSLDLTGQTGTYTVHWYDPRDGGALQSGSVTQVAGGAAVSLGNSPNPGVTTDWVVLVRRAPDLTSSDIGSVGLAGSYSYANGVHTVSGAGADIWGNADGFRYAYRQITGDGTVTARVLSQTNTHSSAKAGVMIRASLNSNAIHASTLLSPGNGVRFQRRTSTGGTSATSASTTDTAPVWVRVQRIGNTFTAFRSADGTSWTQVGTATMVMPVVVYAGLAVTSHTTSALSTAGFDFFEIEGGL